MFATVLRIAFITIQLKLAFQIMSQFSVCDLQHCFFSRSQSFLALASLTVCSTCMASMATN